MSSRPSSGGSLGGGDCYDIPRTPIPVASVPVAYGNDVLPSYDIPRSTPVPCADTVDSYDVPRPLGPSALTPSSSLSSLTTDSMSGSNRSSLAPEYDVPRSRPPTATSPPQIQPHHQHIPLQSSSPAPLHQQHQPQHLQQVRYLLIYCCDLSFWFVNLNIKH